MKQRFWMLLRKILIQVSELTLFKKYKSDPSLWMRDVLGVDSLQDYHKQIALDVSNYDRVTIKACHSVGKTWLSARLALWFFSTYDNAIVITTAPTFRQVKSLLWGEIRDAYKNANPPIGGRMLDTELKLSDKHFMMGFSPQAKAAATGKEQQGSSFQGFHSDNVMVIVDEAVGVSKDIWLQAEGILTSGDVVKFVTVANPTTKNCVFFETFSNPSWKKITISCFNSPNMVANGFIDKETLEDEIDRLSVMQEEDRLNEIQTYQKPVPYLVTAQFIIPYVMRLGFDHPLVLSKVFGEFPRDEDNVLVQYEDVEKAIRREIELNPHAKRTIGVDVARFGVDKTVITEMMGLKNTAVKTLVKRDLTHVAGEVINMIKSRNCETIVLVDATGLGAGVYDFLIQSKREGYFEKNVRIEEIHFGGSPFTDDHNDEEKEQEKNRYFNLKAKLFDLLGYDLKHNIDLMDRSEFLEELPSIQYKFDSKGRIVIESKKDYKKRTGRPSPDYSDSLALANYGRYVSINYGSFKDNVSAKPLVKQDGRQERRTGIRISEY